MTTPQFVLPGDSLASSTPGQGTFLSFPSTLSASLAGTPSATAARTRITGPWRGAPLPRVGDAVLGRVTRVTLRAATLELIAATSTTADGETEPFAYAHGATLRAQDVRATELDKVVLPECYHVGDVVRAKVISLGDERSYYVSTAGNEYGVVLGWSESGRLMAGVGWGEMLEVETGRREARKVAKVV